MQYLGSPEHYPGHCDQEDVNALAFKMQLNIYAYLKVFLVMQNI